MVQSSPTAPPDGAIAVSELARRARLTLERSFPVLWVSGELSGVTRATSGHLYFSLKDESAQVRCVMFRSRSQLLAFEPRPGLRVEVRAQVSLYEARGDFQLTVDAMRRAGVGALHEAFLRLKADLEREGLFDAARKRALPALPARLAIVTSPGAAALRDVLSTLARRAPHIGIVLLPCLVQGAEAPAQIAGAIMRAGSTGCDAVLVVRGGGSAEDLMAFNDERVARAIVACPVPVVSGVGHETDFSIADFVADVRAATPTAAAELVSAGHVEAIARLAALAARLSRTTRAMLDARGQKMDDLSARLHPPQRQMALARERLHALHERLRRAHAVDRARDARHTAAITLRMLNARPALALRRATLSRLAERLHGAANGMLDKARHRTGLAGAQLAQLDPGAVMSRGFSIVRDHDGRIVRNTDGIHAGDRLSVQFSQGHADVRVEKSCRNSTGKD
jgi:exodeoxyribonuclease VII large subunit